MPAQNLPARNATSAALSARLIPTEDCLFTPAPSYFHASAEGGGGTDPTPAGQTKPLTVRGLPVRILKDQRDIWTSPAHLHRRDLRWLLPVAETTGLLIASDHHVMTAWVNSDAQTIQRSGSVSNYGLAAVAGAPLALLGVSFITHNQHARETGLLAGEAMADSYVADEALKLVTGRERPYQNPNGRFWQYSTILNTSFPSGHSILAWSAAEMIAEEYPGPVTKWGAYGLAAAVSVARITAEKHFPSDVLVGAVSGWLISKYVYRKHHNPSLDDDAGSRPAKRRRSAPAPPSP